MRYPFLYKKLETDSLFVLKKEFPFYNAINAKEQKLFAHRVYKFLDYHTFIGKENIQVDQRMKILIAATGVMLSFGFDRYLYSLFNTILIYPADYFSHISQQNHKGETNPKYGVIVFSWEDFSQGLLIRDDNQHLGLHEFAHALHFSFLTENSHDATVFKQNFQLILRHLEHVEVKKKLVDQGYLRAYAFENQYEFFAVMVEYFYESPRDFYAHHPTLFKLMAQLLRFNLHRY